MRSPQLARPPVRPLGKPSSNQTLLAAAALVAVLGSAGAQSAPQFDELPRRTLASGSPAHAVATGDVDGDGDLDLVLGNDAGQNRLNLNDGRGSFADVTAAQLPNDSDPTRAVVLADIDGDGDLDLVLGNHGQQNRLYTNDGSGAFTDVTTAQMPIDGDHTNAVVAVDVDGDGDLDLVLGNGTQTGGGGEQSRLYLNDGAGVFSDATAQQLPVHVGNTAGVVAGDVDGDGDLDLVLANAGYAYFTPYYSWAAGQQNRLYTNDGSGAFTDVTAQRLPVDLDSTLDGVLCDVDGDGDLDLLLANSNLGTVSYLSVQDRLYTNDGTGTFIDATLQRMPVDVLGTGSLAAGDVDEDGDPDLVLTNPGQSRLYVNDGAGVFGDATTDRMPGTSGTPRDLALADLDGDDDLDLVFGGGQSRLYLNLLRQLDAPDELLIGQDYTLDVYMRHGPVSLGDFALPYASFTGATLPTPFGTLGLDPNGAVALPLIAIPQPAGFGTLSFPVPNVNGLIGQSLYSQALMVGYPSELRFANVVADVFQLQPVDLVVNGGFEQPALSANSWNVFPSIPGWTAVAPFCGIEVQNRVAGLPLAGDQHVETDSNCSAEFYQDLATVAGRGYVLGIGYSPRPGVADNAIDLRWSGATVLSLQADGTGLPNTAWQVHRVLVTATGATERITIADTSISNGLGGYVDEVTAFEVDFATTCWMVIEVVTSPPTASTLCGYLSQAEAAQLANNQAAKAAALQAFTSAVSALPASILAPADATTLLAMAQLL